MSTTQDLVTVKQQLNGLNYEKILTQNDVSGLTSTEKVNYIFKLCDYLELNPITKPIQLIKFQGKEIVYFTKDATEQLRKKNKVSITNIETKMLDGGIYIVTAHASTPDGRSDSSTGVINIKGKTGDDLCNAMLKAETKAKRRVTLSICGLGYIDECEAESIPQAKKIDVYVDKEELEQDDTILSEILYDVENSHDIEDLQDKFKRAKELLKNNKKSLNKLIEAKDKRKSELSNKEAIQEIDFETGEIL